MPAPFIVFAKPFTRVQSTEATRIQFTVDGKELQYRLAVYHIKEDLWDIQLETKIDAY